MIVLLGHGYIGAVVAPRSNCTMNTDKLTNVFPIQDIDTALSNCLKNYK